MNIRENSGGVFASASSSTPLSRLVPARASRSSPRTAASGREVEEGESGMTARKLIEGRWRELETIANALLRQKGTMPQRGAEILQALKRGTPYIRIFADEATGQA